jgi:hypothetical protein
MQIGVKKWRTCPSSMQHLKRMHSKLLQAKSLHLIASLRVTLATACFNIGTNLYQFHIDGANIDIVVINTAMLSGGGHKDLGPDQGKLIIPEFAVVDAIRKLKTDSYRIFATHHPFRTLSEAGSRYLQSTIEEHAHLHLFGHMHDPEGRNSHSFRGTLFSNQAGAIFTQRKGAYIGYSLISVDRVNLYYENHLRTYFDDRKYFDEARDVIPEGRFYSSQPAREYWRKIATPVEEGAFRAHLAGPCLAAFQAELENGPGDPRFAPDVCIATYEAHVY